MLSMPPQISLPSYMSFVCLALNINNASLLLLCVFGALQHQTVAQRHSCLHYLVMH